MEIMGVTRLREKTRLVYHFLRQGVDFKLVLLSANGFFFCFLGMLTKNMILKINGSREVSESGSRSLEVRLVHIMEYGELEESIIGIGIW